MNGMTKAQRAKWKRQLAAAGPENRAAEAAVMQEIAEQFPRCAALGLLRRYPILAGRDARADIPAGMTVEPDGYGGAPAEAVEAFLSKQEPESCPI